MVINCVYIYVKEEYLQEFIEASLKNHQGTRGTEAGNMRFDVLQQADDPCKFMLYEVFESEDAVALHKETEQYKAWRDTVNPMMADKRYGVRHHALAPDSKELW